MHAYIHTEYVYVKDASTVDAEGYIEFLCSYDCLCNLGVLFVGVLVRRALLLGVYIGSLFFGNSHIDLHMSDFALCTF